ncbi:MAG: hypothetical protein IPP33_02120 [Flavobacteriales bacterium]|nr:hypothetical protein [Flavobacteriales bacterium]
MMRVLDYSLVLALLLMGCTNTPPKTTLADIAPTEVSVELDPLADFRQLTGAWTDSTTSDRFQSFEKWTAQGDSLLTGFGYAMANGDTVFIEDLKLEFTQGHVVYSARIDSQNNGAWVPFTAQPSGPDSLVFENPGHDFPQCITYVKDSSGAWDVAVTGNENGSERIERFRFRKEK